MPIPKAVGRWNKAELNRLTRHLAPCMPGLGVVVHRGRRPGRRYQTPVNVFPADGGYLFAVTSGPDTDWVKNVLAAGGCELRTRGQTIQLGSPRLFHDESRSAIRPVERQVLRILGVADFLSLTPASASTAAPSQPARPRETSNERIAVTVAIGLAAQPRCVQMLHLRLDRAAVRWGCGLLSPLVRITRGSGCHGEPRQSAEAAERHAIGKFGYNCGG